MRPTEVGRVVDGARYGAGGGDGLLVTIDHVASSKQKAELAASLGATAVDMEAATLARAAAEAGVEFSAVKAISDGVGAEFDFTLPFMRADGFATGSFLAHAALRPQWWPSLTRLACNASRAAEALAAAVAEDVAARGLEV